MAQQSLKKLDIWRFVIANGKYGILSMFSAFKHDSSNIKKYFLDHNQLFLLKDSKQIGVGHSLRCLN